MTSPGLERHLSKRPTMECPQSLSRFSSAPHSFLPATSISTALTGIRMKMVTVNGNDFQLGMIIIPIWNPYCSRGIIGEELYVTKIVLYINSISSRMSTETKERRGMGWVKTNNLFFCLFFFCGGVRRGASLIIEADNRPFIKRTTAKKRDRVGGASP